MPPSDPIAEIDPLRQHSGKSPTYLRQAAPQQHDNRPYEDQWQREVYARAKTIALSNGFLDIVDFGCGSGFKLMKYFRSFRTIGIEIDPALSFLREKYAGRDWRDGSSYDASCFEGQLTVCADVLEHLEAPCDLLETMRRSSCSVFVFSTPVLEILAARGHSPLEGPPTNGCHVREWTTAEFEILIAEVFG